MAKSYDYIIELKKGSSFAVDAVSRLMLMIAIAVFGYTVYLLKASGATLYGTTGMLMIILIAGMIGWWIHCTVRHRKGRTAYYRLGLLFATIGWTALARTNGLPIFYWIAAFYFVAVLLEKQVKFPREIAFDNDGMVINSFPQKNFAWKDLSNVVLKDRILTVDFKNNKIIQQETQEDTTAAEEAEFNGFCRSKLTA